MLRFLWLRNHHTIYIIYKLPIHRKYRYVCNMQNDCLCMDNYCGCIGSSNTYAECTHRSVKLHSSLSINVHTYMQCTHQFLFFVFHLLLQLLKLSPLYIQIQGEDRTRYIHARTMYQHVYAFTLTLYLSLLAQASVSFFRVFRSRLYY